MKTVSLFSGIGGFEVALQRAGFEVVASCENDSAASEILATRFPDVPNKIDITTVRSLPNCDLITAGWPCQDLSQAGRTAGINGKQSGLVSHLFRLLDAKRKRPEYLLLENVAFALHLNEGKAIKHVVKQLEKRGYNWAYRVLDTQNFGLPHRRRRVFIVAALSSSPLSILFDGSSKAANHINPLQIGFYWTEGNRGIGWTPEGIPPLKGGSGLSIPSPPAIWDIANHNFFVPSIKDAERLQGFSSDWTSSVIAAGLNERVRWRLVGNAVSVPVVQWIGRRINAHAGDTLKQAELPEAARSQKHNLAYGGPGLSPCKFNLENEGPSVAIRSRLSHFRFTAPQELSHRAASGFYSRLLKSPLRLNPDFLSDLGAFCDRTKIIVDKAA